MKTLRVFGWAAIFTATLLLAACASHTPKVADTDMTSGPDTTLAQFNDEGISTSDQRLRFDTYEAHLLAREGYANDRQQRLDRLENEVIIRQAWLNERESQLEQRESDVDRRENSLVINQAWLNEREMLVDEKGSRVTSSAILAGADSSQTKVEAGRCYASVYVPAQYRTVAVTKPIAVPKGETLPTLYQSVTEQIKVSDEQMSWEEVLCDEDKTECRIIEVQRALSRGGYNPGPIDGVVGQQTMTAVNSFQKDFNLTVANYLTIETVKALDANF